MLGGLVIPTPTLFSDEGRIDGPRNARFSRWISESGVDHLFVLGTLGEFPLVEDAERAALLESVIESLAPRCDVWVGCGAPSTARAVRLASQAEEAGATAVVAVPPYYLHPTEAGIADYYRAIHAAVRVPVLAYNIPGFVGYALHPPLVHRLAHEGVLAGIKDTSGSLESVRGFLTNAPEGFSVLPGDDRLASDSLRSGASGAVMGVANVVPQLGVEFLKAVRTREEAAAADLQGLVDQLAEVVGTGPFPSTTKFLLAHRTGLEVGYRPPFGPLTAEESASVLTKWAAIAPKLARFA